MIITIDGPVATGKSIVAKKLAESVGFIFFDTGAMYRTLTFAILKKKIDFHQQEQLEEFLKNFEFDIKFIRGEKRYFFENEDISQKIRGKEITLAVIQVSSMKSVRAKLTTIIRELAVGVNAVFEGRDMGTEIFPDAAIKIFLVGDDKVRAQRRYEELKIKHPEESSTLTLEKCLEDILKRDTHDKTREVSPLRQAEDAYVIDTSNISIDEVVYKILEYKDSIKTKQSS